MMSIKKIVVLGGNGAMGSSSGAVFAMTGIPTQLLARTLDKAQAGRARAEQLAKGRIAAGSIQCGSYEELEEALRDADLILEAVAESLAIKRELLARVDRLRSPSSIVATVTSGLSIATLCAERSASFQRNFLGIHLFNPPTSICGCELIAHAGTDPGVIMLIRDFLTSACAREVVETTDSPGFAGNRIGFKVLNEVAQLAEEHGVAFMDHLLGSHTGRALPPLGTIDLVGWDVHAAIVDHLRASTYDIAHDAFTLPAYMRRGLAAGTLGRKTRDKGGFFRIDGKGDEARHFVLDPATGDYRPLELASTELADTMKAAIRGGRHVDAMEVFCTAEGREAELLRRILLGYISYALGLVGEVVAQARDIDRIMGFGFLWAPPGVLVDAIGARRTITMLDRAKLPVPPVILDSATHERPLFTEPLDRSRYFAVAA